MNTSKKSWLLALLSLSTLIGCSTTVETYHPGFYQEGHLMEGGYQPAYYDAYGNLHPAQPVADYYEEGRWHRAYVTKADVDHAPGTVVYGVPTGQVSHVPQTNMNAAAATGAAASATAIAHE